MPSAFKLHNVRDKIARVERCEISDFFSGADETRWDSKFILDRNDDPAFAAAIEFSDNQTGKRHCTVEFTSLVERISTSACVDHEQCFMRCLRIELAKRPLHLCPHGHELGVGLEKDGVVERQEGA